MTKDLVRTRSKVPLWLYEENKNIFRFFRFFGLFPISYKNGEFIVHKKVIVISRIIWFFWHLAGIATVMFIRLRVSIACDESVDLKRIVSKSDGTRFTEPEIAINDCDDDKGALYRYAMFSLAMLFFILIDPVQSIILKRTLNFMPKILKEIKHLESLDLVKHSTQNYKVTKIFMRNKTKKELKNKESISTGSTINICMNDELESNINTTTPQVSNLNELESNITTQTSDLNDEEVANRRFGRCYTYLRLSILRLALVVFFISFVLMFYYAVRPQEGKRHDIKDEYKFFGSMFCLVFPVLTTWFGIFFIGYQRKMYRILNELPDDLFSHEEHFKDIGEYLDTMVEITDILTEHIYRFLFGINFAVFVTINALSSYELMQGISQVKKHDKMQFGDILYLFPLVICTFHMFISCEHGTHLIHDEHDILEYKFKGILASLMEENIEMYEENPKKLRRVEVLYMKFKNLHPYVTIYGGFNVNYKIFTGIVLFSFGYARIFLKDNPV